MKYGIMTPLLTNPELGEYEIIDCNLTYNLPGPGSELHIKYIYKDNTNIKNDLLGRIEFIINNEQSYIEYFYDNLLRESRSNMYNFDTTNKRDKLILYWLNNVDDLVKRIDAKIAELEEEERKEKELEQAKQAENKPVIEELPVLEETITKEPEEIYDNKESNTVNLETLSQQTTNKITEDENEDDKFFDDFFSDE